MIIAALGQTTKTVLRVLIWALPVLLTVAIGAAFYLLAARIARVERRSYLRGLTAIVISIILCFIGEAIIVATIGKNNWVLIPWLQVSVFLPIPIVFRVSFSKSLLMYLLTTLMIMAFILIAGLIAIAFGMPFPSD
ncbi:MAG: hypothetical protein WCS70_02865 [Verrucomicrobiota bacterium]